MRSTRILFSFFFFTCFLASFAFAQPIGSAAGDPVLATIGDVIVDSYGTAQSSVEVVGMNNINPPNDTVTYGTSILAAGISLYQTSTSQVDWWYQIRIPSGALVQSVAIDACDGSATGALSFGLAMTPTPGANIALATTGTAETPGCTTFSATVSSPPTMDNGANELWFFIAWAGSFGSGQRVNAVRVSYRRQVSPSPASATFPNDVPTGHPFFRFVEAMAAAGITGGCGPGAYCPNSAVTRGQMAVFLSTALGLHFAP